MKAIFISYNQAYGNELVELLEKFGQRGFTQWLDIQGRGSVDGIPHYGNHAWPEQNYAILTVVPDEKVAPILDALRQEDKTYKELGLRAFVWNIEQAV